MTGRAPAALLLVGAGQMGSLHARVISTHPDARLVGVVDPDQAVGQALAARWNTTWRGDVGSLAGVDGVVIAAPTPAHDAVARHVLDAGLPLLVEKPLTASIDQTRQLLEVSRQRDIPLMCGLLERFNPAVVTALPLVKAPIALRSVRHSPYAPRIVTGVGWDLAIHDVDLALRFAGGRAVDASGVVGAFSPHSAVGAEDVVEATIQFDTGAIASVSASRLAQRKVRQLVVYELERSIEIDLLLRDVIIYQHVAGEAIGPDGRGYRQQAVIEIPELVTSREPLAAQLDRFLELLSGQGDAAAERASIAPPHEVVGKLLSAATQGER
ncbi:MAG: Gfo/Idh/MocA family oxidoreductase [Bifidobacteriaceae bacterium]|jgi:predicted dehydrogenase|nr:Gfo/Idh/MocA family oxidoreductase [Bifidobacteriaceae bacterium]